jgi:hypothetical protein
VDAARPTGAGRGALGSFPSVSLSFSMDCVEPVLEGASLFLRPCRHCLVHIHIPVCIAFIQKASQAPQEPCAPAPHQRHHHPFYCICHYPSPCVVSISIVTPRLYIKPAGSVALYMMTQLSSHMDVRP